MASSYWLTRLFYLRGLGALYVLIGVMLYFQGPDLIGPNGLTPVKTVSDQLQSQGKTLEVFLKYPSLLFVTNSEATLYAMSALCFFLGLLLFWGKANGLMLLALWFIQLSLVNGAGRFWSFGWETMMLEMTLLSVFFVHPWRWDLLSKKNVVPTYLALLPLLWMMFRLMLGAGLIKIRGDACWLDFTCMDYHYQTQPNPHPLSHFYHHRPLWFHRFEIGMTHFYELFVPVLFLLPRLARISGGVLIIVFQMTLISTGNLAYLNWQTMVLALLTFDDHLLSRLVFSKTHKAWRSVKDLSPTRVHQGVALAVVLLVAALSYKPIKNMISPQQRMNESYSGYHLVNSYGLFGSITKVRNEIVIKGTTDSEINENTKWQEYEFYCKPGDISKRPCWITPYHLRLDWQMWFSAMRPRISEPWLVNLVQKMLNNDPAVDRLLEHNPFKDKEAPKFIKMDLYIYKFSDPGDKDWWRREFKSAYMPPVSLSNFQTGQ
jgi:hypothetical protein